MIFKYYSKRVLPVSVSHLKNRLRAGLGVGSLGPGSLGTTGSGGFQASFAYQNDIIRTHDVDCRMYVFPVAPFVAVVAFYTFLYFI